MTQEIRAYQQPDWSGTGDLAQAENDLRYALAIRLKLLPADHNWIGISVDTLARVLQSEGKQSEVVNVRQEIENAKQRQILDRARH